MTGWQWVGVIGLAVLLAAFVIHQGRSLGYRFVLGLLGSIVGTALLVMVLVGLALGRIP